MTKTEWEDKFSVKVRALDDDHKMILDLINQLHEVYAANKGLDDIENVFAVLMTYTEGHFTREEDLMARAHFPGMESHVAGHREIKKELDVLHKRFLAGEKAVMLDLLAFLNNWWHFHILEEDHAYVGALLKEGLTDKA